MMKTFYLLIVSAFLTSGVFAQEAVSLKNDGKPLKEKRHIALAGKKVKRVPDAVSNAFLQAHPNADKTTWYRKKEIYKVQYFINGSSHIAVYDAQGNRLD
jgi:hypothetical protein